MQESQTASGATDLTGSMLIAMPGMGDPRFEHAVIYMCAHSDDGAMGLIVNKPSADVSLGALLQQLEIEGSSGLDRKSVYFGGPVEMGRGFVLHGADYRSDLTTLQVDDTFCMTGTLDVLEHIARGDGPSQWLAMLGYAGWGPGQLEQELAQNAWLVCAPDPALVFATPDEQKWGAALKRLGIPALALSAEGGRA
ncbi:YqgE/AlgH family protein [Salipiger marinus]|jgi:putative transcriptional regulator|uniref:YqgE/AlgH family protein n=1 Tax=Salipiger marinus TaxID=555512 RepID=UPI001E2D2108|nr:YqgE/AlgH family protein [Salipiger manganoxidans]MCD1618422.1 YqgE/AlgH family protein [Salipiger manganoxidans]MEB3417981.1 YqgE/AlgH family protein [Salipiger manganoxidans]